MKKVAWSGIIAVAGILLGSAPALAQSTANGTVNVTANVNARAKLTLGSGTSYSLTFNDADPDVSPTLTASAFNVAVKARTSAAGTVSLTVQAGGDLVSGTDQIAISNLTWTATGTNFVAGTSDSATAQSVGSWTGSGNYAGTQTYALVNSWAYNTGTYTATLNYTLTAP